MVVGRCSPCPNQLGSSYGQRTPKLRTDKPTDTGVDPQLPPPGTTNGHKISINKRLCYARTFNYDKDDELAALAIHGRCTVLFAWTDIIMGAVVIA